MFGKVWQSLAERFFDRDRDVPQVSISLKLEDKRAEPESPASEKSVQVRWTMKLELTNESSAPAADLKLVWPSGRRPFKVVLPYHLSAFEEKGTFLRGETKVDRQRLEEADLDEQFRLLLPDPILILTYRDVRGDYYHSRYSRSEGRELVEFLKKLPPESE